jgi:hypothetical protein
MDAIKKKMQAMKLEKDNAMDRALLCEQQARDANLRAEKVSIPSIILIEVPVRFIPAEAIIKCSLISSGPYCSSGD